MKNYEIIGVLNTYRQTTGELRLPASVAWKRRLNIKKLGEIEKLIKEAEREIQQGYSDDTYSMDMGDGMRQVRKEYLTEYNKKLNELYEQDTPVEIQKISIEDLGNLDISDKEMDTIAFMIEEEPDA